MESLDEVVLYCGRRARDGTLPADEQSSWSRLEDEVRSLGEIRGAKIESYASLSTKATYKSKLAQLCGVETFSQVPLGLAQTTVSYTFTLALRKAVTGKLGEPGNWSKDKLAEVVKRADQIWERKSTAERRQTGDGWGKTVLERAVKEVEEVEMRGREAADDSLTVVDETVRKRDRIRAGGDDGEDSEGVEEEEESGKQKNSTTRTPNGRGIGKGKGKEKVAEQERGKQKVSTRGGGRQTKRVKVEIVKEKGKRDKESLVDTDARRKLSDDMRSARAAKRNGREYRYVWRSVTRSCPLLLMLPDTVDSESNDNSIDMTLLTPNSTQATSDAKRMRLVEEEDSTNDRTMESYGDVGATSETEDEWVGITADLEKEIQEQGNVKDLVGRALLEWMERKGEEGEDGEGGRTISDVIGVLQFFVEKRPDDYTLHEMSTMESIGRRKKRLGEGRVEVIIMAMISVLSGWKKEKNLSGSGAQWMEAIDDWASIMRKSS